MTPMQNSDGAPWGAALIASPETGPEIAFRCLDGSLLVIAALEPTDLKKAMEKAGPQKSVDLTYAVNGAAPVEDDWLYLRRHRAVASADQAVTRPLYNAAARGETLSIDAGKRGEADYALPAPDADAFAAFVDACGFAEKSE